MIALAALLLTADCAGCHPVQVAALASSRHAVSASLPAFQQAAHGAGRKWCLGCHRPEGDGSQGLTCASCHAVEGDPGAVLGVGPVSLAAMQAHRVVASGSGPSAVCARCHQFNAPRPGHFDPVEYSDHPLQNTVQEAGGQSCSSCHDSHQPMGGHDRATLISGVQVTAAARNGQVELTVTASTGHRFPTGDMFRRLELVVCADRACTSVLDSESLGRVFGSADEGFVLLRDGSLADGESRLVRLVRGRFWAARYRYADPRLERWLERTEVLTEVASGELDFGDGAP